MRDRLLSYWERYGVFWLGALLVGLVSVGYASLMDSAFALFRRIEAYAWWLPLVLTPAGAALAVWLTRKYFQGAEGSGIPQVIATLEDHSLARSLLSFRIMIGKIIASFIGMLCGFTIGREGPTVQIGASLMYAMRRGYRHSSEFMENQLATAGAAAGLAAAFNTPLAGIVFAIEELNRNFASRTSGILIAAMLFSGVVTISLQGNYLYFGQIKATIPWLWSAVPILLAAGIITGLFGGLFCWLLLNTLRWLPSPLALIKRLHPVWFAAICGLVLAIVGVVSGGATFGSGYAEARSLLETQEPMSPFYAPLKFIALTVSYMSGIPGGIFAPGLAIGAGIGNLLSMVVTTLPLQALAALCMVGFLSAITQSPLTAFVIMVEMTDGNDMMMPLMAVSLLATQVSKCFWRLPFYHALALNYLPNAGQAKAAQQTQVT
ncbi:chloride channel protein [Pusillimonas sp. CC-YST705]|uniref:Chloride channel protein n=2 Tax=Mesopusillimonas faecipullorum TaxID=2755040 RepID=A0ABS8CBS9_9BURK|nr:chloride channel protein [Mesopusillimonas faecipullorum]